MTLSNSTRAQPGPPVDLSWLRDAPEVLYRSLRPTFGHVARSVVGAIR